MDDYKFDLIENFKGYNSTSDKTKLDPGFLIRGSKNVYKKITGTIASRPGLKRRGTADDTNAGVKSSFEWQTSVGTFRALRVCNGKLEVESDILVPGTYVWYELFETSTIASLASSFTRFVFDTAWDSTDASDKLLFVRGDDKMFHWSGGIATVASSTATTITKNGTETWAEIGFQATTADRMKIIIEGREFTYTGGTDTTTLTGVTANTGDASTITPNAVAIQSVYMSDNEPVDGFECDFIKVIGNQAWVGSYSSRVVYISADTDFFDFENAGAYIEGDPDLITLDAPCRGIGQTGDGKVILFGGTSDMYIVTPNFSVPVAYTDGSNTRYIIQKVEKKPLSGLSAALGHEFIGNFGNYVVWIDQKNQLRSQGAFANVDDIRPVTLSLPVRDELAEDDFTGGHLRVIGDVIHITAPNNGRDWMYEIRDIVNDQGQVVSERLWQPPQIRGVQRIAVIGGVTYGHSNVNPQIYQMFDTEQWFDDSPSDEPIPYSCIARFAYRQHNRREGLVTFDKVYFEGYMYEGVPLYTFMRFEYQGALDTRDMIINTPTNQAQFWTGTVAPSLGDASLGDNPLGEGLIPEGGDQELVPKFRDIVGITPIKGGFFEYGIEIYSTSVDSRWELLCFGPNIRLASQQPSFLNR